MPSFSIPLSGLTAASDQLQSVSNNLANLNTSGFKDQNITFASLFSQAGTVNGSGDPVQTGSGVTPASTQSNFTEGNVNATGTASNMAISGNGFFVTQESSGLQDYTRAGDFTANKGGQLTTPNGELVMGYPAVAGVVNTATALQAIQVGANVTSPAAVTQNLNITANLNSATAVAGTATSTVGFTDSTGGANTVTVAYVRTAPNTWTYTATIPAASTSAGGSGTTSVGSGTLTYNSAGQLAAAPTKFSIPALADGAPAAPASVAFPAPDPDFAASTTSSTLPVYDSLGSAHTVAISYTKTAANQWIYSATVPTADFTPGATGTTQISSGTLSFDTSGKMVLVGSPAVTTIPLTIPPVTSPVTKFASGAASMSFNWNLEDASGNTTITQTATASATSATSQDGYASGTLTSYAVQPDGTVQGTFTSGKQLALGQVALASFGNVQGLVSTGHNNYQATGASGSAVIGVAGTGGRGTVVGGSVEQSNVDLAAEFSKLIVAQQYYSANAKTITTFNQVSQATIAMLQ